MRSFARLNWRLPVLLLACAIPAMPATVTYRFVGQCALNDCTGVGTGLLTLQNYTLGTPIDATLNFVSLTYSSNLISFTITQSDPPFVSGSLPATLPGVASLTLSTPGNNIVGKQLETQNSGWWCAGATCSADYGNSHTWSLYTAPPPATPAPAGTPTLSDYALLTLAVGIAVMGGILLKTRADRSL
jgi:hypothetical protein